MLNGAPDGRVHRRFHASNREEARLQARNTAFHLAGYGLHPVAEHWDEAAGALVVAFAAGPSATIRRPGRLRGRALVVGLSLVLLVGGLSIVGQSPSGDAGRAANPLNSPPPTALPIADGYDGPIPHFEPAECRTDWLIGRETECGDLIVAEDRSRPEGRRISLHVAIQRSYSRRAQPDPVVYLDGGPGGSPLLDGFWSGPFLEERDLIVFDQRGTGLSQPSLDCPEIVLVFLRDEIDALRDCRRRLVERADLAAYNSAASAADLADLRMALGYDEWNLYGISYGTRLALTAMRDHPTGIRSVILDSVYPPQRDLYAEGARNAQRAFDKLFSACSEDADCRAAFPDLEAHFYEVVARLDDRPRHVGGVMGLGGTSVDGSMLVNLLFYRLYMTDFLGEIPLSLDGYWKGDWEQLELWLMDLVGLRRADGLLSTSEGLHYSVQCAEELPFTDHDLRWRDDPAVHAAVALAFDWQATVDACAMWDVPAAPALENLPVSSDIPALLLTGTYDPITPPEWAEAASASLGQGQVFVVPGVGHGVLGTSFCVDDMVEQFLERPSRAVEAGCLDRLGEPEFVLP